MAMKIPLEDGSSSVLRIVGILQRY